jgi:tRNA(Ile)-lysidine synthase
VQLMLDKAKSILRDDCGLRKDALIVVGVSGGPDSLCLLDLLMACGYPVLAAHFNHRLRPEAEAEAGAVAELAHQRSIPYAAGSSDVGQYARVEGFSIEEAARTLRYQFLFSQARAHRAQAVAVGHTADDQAETVLMHFIRGTGLNGLTGMSHKNMLSVFDPEIPLIRPLLAFWREQTIAYCAARGLRPIDDPSNKSTEFLRNRLRGELIPELETYNPRIREALWRNARALASDANLLNEVVLRAWGTVVTRAGHTYVALDFARLTECTIAMRRRLLRLAAEQVAPGQEIGYLAIDRAESWLSGASRGQVDLSGGVVLRRESELLYVSAADAQLPSDAWPQLPDNTQEISTSVPAIIGLSDGWQFRAERVDIAKAFGAASLGPRDPFTVLLDAASLPENLLLRMRRPGDRMQPAGMNGHFQKVSDIFVNAKVPARARRRWPLLCAGEEIVWVPGYRSAEAFRLRKSSISAVQLSISAQETM